MPIISYISKQFRDDSLDIIDQANAICREYGRAGFDLTLRQLYYQFVARDLLPNTQKSYNRLGSIISDARMAGLLDWNYLVDRTRGLESRSHWNNPRDIIRTAARSYHTDWWEAQRLHVEVWVEKEALAGVVAQACQPFDVGYLSCRGYLSQSEAWAASLRFARQIKQGKRVVVLHLGDHDPSGMDMSRDNTERVGMMIATNLDGVGWRADFNPDEVADALRGMASIHDLEAAPAWWDSFLEPPAYMLERIALNMDQVRQYNPPPNPAKMTDSRADDYVAEFGRQSWELDALRPEVLVTLIQSEIERLADIDLLDIAKGQEAEQRDRIEQMLEQHGHMLDVATEASDES